MVTAVHNGGMDVSALMPVWPGAMADPFVLSHGGAFNAYGTAPADPSSGLAFRVLRSEDLGQWECLGGALKPLGDPAVTSYWAPEVIEHRGRFLMYYSAGGHAGAGHQVRLATAERPGGPFVDSGRILMPEEPFTIDASPFRDPADGRWYLFFARDYLDGDRPGTGIAVVPLADDLSTPLAAPVTVVRGTADWQVFERDRAWCGRTWPAWYTVEGPCVLYHGGRYWCLYSGGRWESDGYGVGCVSAAHPLGPWRESPDGAKPSVLKTVPGQLLGPGHNSVVRDPRDGSEYIVFHAWDQAMTARRMHIARLEWTPEGPTADLGAG